MPGACLKEQAITFNEITWKAGYEDMSSFQCWFKSQTKFFFTLYNIRRQQQVLTTRLNPFACSGQLQYD
jgi:hypothetical protein